MITAQNYQEQYPKIKDKLPKTDRDGNDAERTFKESYDFLVENDSRDTKDVKELFVEKINEALGSEGKSAPAAKDEKSYSPQYYKISKQIKILEDDLFLFDGESLKKIKREITLLTEDLELFK